MTDLIGRLRAHAEAHEHVAPQDGEQQQWMRDLREAADMIEKLRAALTAACAVVQAEAFRTSTIRERALLSVSKNAYSASLSHLRAVIHQSDEALGADVERPE